MKKQQKITAAALSGLAIAGFVAATAFVNPQAAAAQSTTAVPASAVAGDPRGGMSGRDAALAQALGITEEALQTARTAAHKASIEQAVKDGQITQAQADALLSNTGRLRGMGIDLRGRDASSDVQLAAALGITVEQLQAAEEKAAAANLAQAVTDGKMTQAQADQVTAERALAKYIADKGLYKAAVDSAVKDGVITQAQADAILADAQDGPRGGFGGFGGPGGKGGGRH